MNRVEQIEGKIKDLAPHELRAFREWFAQYDSEVWDRQIEADAGNGKLAALADRALRDHENCHSTEL